MIEGLVAAQKSADGLQVVRLQLREQQPGHESEALGPDHWQAILRVLVVLINAVEKILLAPAADSGLRIRRDVGAHDYHSGGKAELLSARQGQARERLTLFGGRVALRAAGERRQILAIPHSVEAVRLRDMAGGLWRAL